MNVRTEYLNRIFGGNICREYLRFIFIYIYVNPNIVYSYLVNLFEVVL